MAKQFEAENQAFQEDGFVLVPGLLNPEETKILVQTAHGDQLLQKSAFELADVQGFRVEPRRRRHHGHCGAIPTDRGPHGNISRRRSLPLSLQDDSQRAPCGWGMGMAPGLRVLVSEWMLVSVYGELPDSG